MDEWLLPGGRKFVLSKAEVRLAQVGMAHRDTSVWELWRERGLTPRTLLPAPTRGARLREHGEKVLAA